MALGLFALAAALGAAVPTGTGERLAKEAIALVSFAGMGNIGARDPDFRGTPFPETDIAQLVDTEVAPVLAKMARLQGRQNSPQTAELLAMLKSLPRQLNAGKGVLLAMYEQEKLKCINTHGVERGGVALSTMIQTVIHQKKLALRELAISMPGR